MKKALFTILFGLALCFNVEARKYPGQIIFQNDTMNVTFNIPFKLFSLNPNYERLQYRVKYFGQDGKPIILKPDQAKEIRFKFEGEDIRMISRYNTLGLGSIFNISANIFLRIEIEGKLKLFRYYYTQSSGGYYNGTTGMWSGGYSYTVEKYVLQKGNGELMRPRALSFKKDMAKYFNDCPELVTKIEKKDFRRDDLTEIVDFYNTSCK